MAKFAAALIATVEAGTIAVTWSDCGDSSTHVKVTDLQPTSIETGTTAQVVGTGTLDEDITGGTFSAVVKAAGVTIVSCSGDASADIVCKLPLGVGSISVKALPFPMSAGSTSITAEVKTISLIPAKLAVTTSHVEAVTDTGDKLACLDLNTNAEWNQLVCLTAPVQLAHQCALVWSPIVPVCMMVVWLTANAVVFSIACWAVPVT